MPVESATYISDLNSSNPGPTDLKSEGDDHIRLLKSTVKATFPNVTGAVTKTHTQINNALSADGGGNVTIPGNYILSSATASGSLTGYVGGDATTSTVDTSRVIPNYGLSFKVMSWSGGGLPVANLAGKDGISLWVNGTTEAARITTSAATFNVPLVASIPWTSVTGKPSNVSYFSNDSGYQTTSGTVTNVSGTGSVTCSTVNVFNDIQTTGGNIYCAGRLFAHSATGGTGLGRITTTNVTGTPTGTNVGDMVLVF